MPTKFDGAARCGVRERKGPRVVARSHRQLEQLPRLNVLNKLMDPIREFGSWAGVLYIIDRAFARISPELRLFVYEIVVQPISNKPLIPSRWIKNLVFREIERGDPLLALMPARDDIKEQRYRQRAKCLGAFKQDKLIGYIWFANGSYEEDEVKCTFVVTPVGESVFDFDLYLFPEHRMGLGFVALWNGANEYLHGRGVKYTFSRLTRFNMASRRAHERLGSVRVGTTIFLRLWRLEFMFATIFPYLHLCLGTRRARLKLEPSALLEQRAAL